MAVLSVINGVYLVQHCPTLFNLATDFKILKLQLILIVEELSKNNGIFFTPNYQTFLKISSKTDRRVRIWITLQKKKRIWRSERLCRHISGDSFFHVGQRWFSLFAGIRTYDKQSWLWAFYLHN